MSKTTLAAKKADTFTADLLHGEFFELEKWDRIRDIWNEIVAVLSTDHFRSFVPLAELSHFLAGGIWSRAAHKRRSRRKRGGEEEEREGEDEKEKEFPIEMVSIDRLSGDFSLSTDR